MAALEEPASKLCMVDRAYEFSAPRFYNFSVGETDEDVRMAELWFEKNQPYAPSPFMVRIKATRTIQPQILCNLEEDRPISKELESSEVVAAAANSSNSVEESVPKSFLCNLEEDRPISKELESSEVVAAAANSSNSVEESVPKSLSQAMPQAEMSSAEGTAEVRASNRLQAELIQPETRGNVSENNLNESNQVDKIIDAGRGSSQENGILVAVENSAALPLEVVQVCTPAQPKQTDDKKVGTAKKIASLLRNPSSMNSKKQMQKSEAKSVKPSSVRRDTGKNMAGGTPNFAQENHAIKRQKLEGGKSRQILTVNKTSNLPHKTRNGIISNSSNFNFTNTKTSKEERKIYVREPSAQFISSAEIMRKFQSGTRDLPLPRNSSLLQGKPKLTLTRPKTPEFETSQRVRSSVKIKSSSELEEEMMAKVPKFKARPFNKKIFEAPTLPPLPRSTPHPPEFKEFHLETMSRATKNSETSTVASTESIENHHWKPQLKAPRSPVLQTSLRARPTKIKSFDELEKEELQNVQPFKARPLNRKIFESKGDMGIFCHMKKHLTVPQEFNFAVDKRIPPPAATVLDKFDMLSICSETQLEKKPLQRNTTPNPFHLHTEERGAEKEKRMVEELTQKQLEEERARVPKAHPYPYTTDYPVVPPKPEPKPCTKPEPFQLESLLKHEEEMQREMEERRRREMEEMQMRIFKAQPILQEDPIPVPEKIRRPLTEVQEFNLHVDHRATDRAEFDKKIKEKEIVYKRYREESESARMMEEEKALKQLRRTLVPHARPVPNFDRPFLPQKSSKQVTKAKYPKLQIDSRKERRRMVFPSASASSHMR